jgi:hypothetical protein
MSQRDTDAVFDIARSLKQDAPITRHDVEQISAVADVDLGELLDYSGLED